MDKGGFTSHFELYHRAMNQCGASTVAIDAFLNELCQGVDVSKALASSTAPEAAGRFVQSTFQIIENGDIFEVASAFAFGREDLLPDVFQQIVDNLNKELAATIIYKIHRSFSWSLLLTSALLFYWVTRERNWQLAEPKFTFSMVVR